MKSNNWNVLKEKLVAQESDSSKKRKRTDIQDALKNKEKETADAPKPLEFKDNLSATEKQQYVALDCEMVGIGSNGKRSALARAAVVDFEGTVLYDNYVRPKSFVTDFRTKYSGIRKSDLRVGHAVSLEECMHDVAELLKGKILVGHALKNDLSVLMLEHHRSMIRDTACYPVYMSTRGVQGGKLRPRALRELSKKYLGKVIQDGEHDPSVDASTAMMLYRRERTEWEKWIQAKNKSKKAKSCAMARPQEGQKVVSNEESAGSMEDGTVNTATSNQEPVVVKRRNKRNFSDLKKRRELSRNKSAMFN